MTATEEIQFHKDEAKRLFAVRNEERREARRKHYEEEALKIEETKNRLAAEYSIERNAKFEKAWSLAWDYGHSSGFDEVERYFGDLVELIK